MPALKGAGIGNEKICGDRDPKGHHQPAPCGFIAGREPNSDKRSSRRSRQFRCALEQAQTVEDWPFRAGVRGRKVNPRAQRADEGAIRAPQESLREYGRTHRRGHGHAGAAPPLRTPKQPAKSKGDEMSRYSDTRERDDHGRFMSDDERGYSRSRGSGRDTRRARPLHERGKLLSRPLRRRG